MRDAADQRVNDLFGEPYREDEQASPKKAKKDRNPKNNAEKPDVGTSNLPGN